MGGKKFGDLPGVAGRGKPEWLFREGSNQYLMPTLLFSDRPKGFVRSNKKLAVAGDDGGVAGFAERVGGDEFEFGTGFEHKAVSALGNGVAEAIGEHDAGPVDAAGPGAFEAFFPNRYSCFEIDAFCHAGVGVDVDLAVVNDAGADALFCFLMIPDAMGFGDVAFTVHFHGEIFSGEATHGDGDSICVKR